MAEITLGILARNAAKTIVECLESAAPYVDALVVGFGGPSTDGTEDIVREWLKNWNKGKTYREELAGWCFSIDWHDDFARARNEILANVRTEWFVWLDADDILINGEKMRAIVANPGDANCLTFPYHYDEDSYGNLACTLVRERLVRWPQQWTWVGSVHEVLTLPPPARWEPRYVPDIVVRHNPRREKDKGTRNLDLLYKELEQSEPEPPQRLLFYLGRENANRGNLREALMHFNRYISRSPTGEEAAQVAFMTADVIRAAGRPAEAAKAALKAIELAPSWPDAYYLLGRIAYEQRRFEESIEWFSTGSEKSPPVTGLIVDPRLYDYWPAYYVGLAYGQLGNHELALDHLRQAAEFRPDDQIMALITNEQRALDTDGVLKAFLAQHEHLARNDEWLKARAHLKTVPKAIERHPAVMEVLHRTLASTAHVDDPQIMVDLYRNNPRWTAMDDTEIWSEAWRTHPRMAFARKSVTCDPPATILDLGSSDGFISLPLAADGHIVEGFDLDPRCVELANSRAQDLGLRAHYKVGSIDDVEGKYDVALALEIIEHLPEPKAFLDQLDEHARKVIITTPHLAWDNGAGLGWQEATPKQHIRTFDLPDIELLLSGRGRIFDLYRQPHGVSAWIFASYRPRQGYTGTVTFLAPNTLEEWSPRKLAAEGLGGSETALIRLAEELFLDHGLLCSTYGRIDNPGYYNGVRYRAWDEYNPQIGSDVTVAWRCPEAADMPLRTGKLILWCHDMTYQERLTPIRAARFDAIVVLTEWHKAFMLQQYPFLDPEKMVVIGNGVDKVRFALRRKGENFRREPHRVAYTSSPDRGLDFVLEKIWPQVIEKVPDAELHVYYGFNNFGTQPELREYRQRVSNLLISSKNVTLHGRVNQDELAQDLLRTSVWLYPSKTPSIAPWNGADWYETYCIAAVEAQLAGAIPITTDLAALVETVGAGVIIPSKEDNQASHYIEAVVGMLKQDAKALARLRTKVRRAAPALDWAEVSQRWVEDVLNDAGTGSGGSQEHRPDPGRGSGGR